MIRARNAGAFEHNLIAYQNAGIEFVLIEKNGSKKLIRDIEQSKGYYFNKMLHPDEAKKLWVYSSVKRNLLAYAKKNPAFPIIPNYPSQARNREVFKDMKVGEDFYATDMNHCYWRVAMVMNYISKTLYGKCVDQSFKEVRNKALACVRSVEVRTHYFGKEIIKVEHIGNPELIDLYANIRNRAFQIMDNCRNAIGKNYIKHKTDCIYYRAESKQIVEEILSANEMLFTTDTCTYIGNNYFIHGTELKTL